MTEEAAPTTSEQAPTTATPPTPEASKDREYGVYVEETISFEGDDAAEKAFAALKKHATESQTGIVVLVKAGRAIAANPKSAVENLGTVRDLDGDYDVAANSSFKRFPEVKSSLKRSVSIGGE